MIRRWDKYGYDSSTSSGQIKKIKNNQEYEILNRSSAPG